MKKVAIIGAGISGLSAGYFLKDNYEISVYESKNRLGGNSRTISINLDNQDIMVDTGFIVLNDRNYPILNELFDELNIETQNTEMSFSVSSEEYEWAGKNLDTIFANRSNLFKFPMIKGLYDILKFNYYSQDFVKNTPNISLEELMTQMELGAWFKNYYLCPMASAIWSCDHNDIGKYPAESFINFFKNHGLLNLRNRPNWMTLKHRSIEYVQKLEKILSKKGKIYKNSKIEFIKRFNDYVEIKDEKNTLRYDKVIFSNHPEEILKILQNPNPKEKKILSCFKQSRNMAYTHSDENLMPQNFKCWSSWNFKYDAICNKSSITYYMNKLQHIDSIVPIFVTLNPITPIDESKLYDMYEFYHPFYNIESLIASKEMHNIQGMNNCFYSGAYLKNGFHEDGISSSKEIIEKYFRDDIPN